MVWIETVISFPHKASGRTRAQMIEQIVGSLSKVCPIVGALPPGLAGLAPYVKLRYPHFPVPERRLIYESGNCGRIPAAPGVAVHAEVRYLRHDRRIVHDLREKVSAAIGAV